MTAATPREAPPAEIRTPRLHLRRWRREDAAALGDALAESVEHLRGWIPASVAEVAPVPALEARLGVYAASFDAAREWLYAIVGEHGALLGGVGLYPRAASGRVPAAEADAVEVGYWVRASAAGRGYGREAAAAVIDAAAALPWAARLEVRCDPRNAPSAAIPRALGFRHERTERALDGDETMVWTRARAG